MLVYQIVYQENPNINYLVSLTTGFAYQKNDPVAPNKDNNGHTIDPYVLLPIINSDESPDINFGLQVYKAIYNGLITDTSETIGRCIKSDWKDVCIS